MTKSEIEIIVCEEIKKYFHVKEVTSKTRLVLDLHADSLDFYALSSIFEERFNVIFPKTVDFDFKKFPTVKKIIDYIEEVI